LERGIFEELNEDEQGSEQGGEQTLFFDTKRPFVHFRLQVAFQVLFKAKGQRKGGGFMSEERKNKNPKTGRPRKGDGPAFPHEEVDRLLVHGEIVEADDGREMQVRYPSFRAIADRYGVAHSLIADFAKKHNCLQRRKQTAARVKELTDSKLIKLMNLTRLRRGLFSVLPQPIFSLQH
jgi:hypothetical protein